MPKDLPISDFSIKIIQGEPIELPSADMLMDARFERNGGDLVIDGHEQTITLDGYFEQASPADITAGDVRITPDILDSFLKSSHSGEYAQITGTMTDESAVGHITEIVGDVLITRADGTEIIADKGSVIHQGDTIETSADGAANILFADNTSFAVSEDARLSVDEFTYSHQGQEGTSFFSMLKGAFVYTSGIIGKEDPGNVSIDTPTGSIGIRGTVVAGKIDPSGEHTDITILDGAIVVTNAAGTVELDQTFETVRLSGYDSAPEFLGQVSSHQLQSSFESLNKVAGSALGQAFDSQSTAPASDNGNDSAPQNNVAPDGDVTGDNTDGESASVETADTTDSIQAPTTLNSASQPSTTDTSIQTADSIKAARASSTGINSNATHNAQAITEQPINADTTRPQQSNFKFDPLDTPLRVHEFEEQGVRIGDLSTNQDATGVLYSIQSVRSIDMMNNSMVDMAHPAFSINQDTGEITVNDPFSLNFSLYKGFSLTVSALDADGTSITQTYDIALDPLVPPEAERITGTSGDDNLGIDSIGDVILAGGDGNDTITIHTTSGKDTVLGGGGDDRITIFSVDSQDTYDGGAGHDTLVLHNQTTHGSYELYGSETAGYHSLEELHLENSGTLMTVKIDSGTVNNFTGPDGILVVNTDSSGVTLELDGDWERLTSFDGMLFDGSSASAVFHNLETNEFIVTNSADVLNITETGPTGGSGTAETVNFNDTTDFSNIPELQAFL